MFAPRPGVYEKGRVPRVTWRYLRGGCQFATRAASAAAASLPRMDGSMAGRDDFVRDGLQKFHPAAAAGLRLRLIFNYLCLSTTTPDNSGVCDSPANPPEIKAQ